MTRHADQVSIRVKLAALTSAVIVLVVLGQTFQSLANESVIAQEEISLRARLTMVSLAGAVGSLWSEKNVPDLAPFAERIRRGFDVRTLALLSGDGDVVAFHGARPSNEEVHRVTRLRLRGAPRSVWGQASGTLEMQISTPILLGEEVRGHLFCTLRTDEAARRLRELLVGSLITVLFWVAVGGGLTLWITGRFTRPLVELADSLASMGRQGYALPAGGLAEGEIGIVQVRLAELSEELKEERARVSQLNDELRHQIDVVSAGLQAAAAQLGAILDSTRDGILLVRPDGTVLRANGPARALFGAAIADGGERLTERANDREAFEAALARAARSHAPAMVHATLPAAPGAKPRHLRVRVAPLVVSSAAADELVVVAEDVSESRLLEEQMIRSERLASIGTLTAGLAHQIGNHLNAIKGYSQLLTRRARTNDPAMTADLEAITREVRSAAELMERVLVLARTRPPAPAEFELDTLVREALEMTRLAADKAGVRTEAQFEPAPMLLHGEPQLLMQAFLNIIMNALQATPRGGTLRVTSACTAPHQCTISISDTGPGIAPEDLPRIFLPFFTTKPEGEGTGLGLPIADRIVEMHGGTIRVRSTPGEGTTFELSFPVNEPGRDARRAGATPQKEAS